MRDYLLAVYQGVTEASTKEVMGGLLVGLALSLVASGVCTLARKRVSDPFPLLCGLTLLVSAVSMALGVGLSNYNAGRATRPIVATGLGGGPHAQVAPIGRRLLRDADSDGDGRLTPEEAARFVKEADQAGKGWADAPDIDRADRARIGSRSLQDFHPDPDPDPSPRPHPRRGEGS